MCGHISLLDKPIHNIVLAILPSQTRPLEVVVCDNMMLCNSVPEFKFTTKMVAVAQIGFLTRVYFKRSHIFRVIVRYFHFKVVGSETELTEIELFAQFYGQVPTNST